MPEVAVNIVTWNSAPFVEPCLQALYAQDYQDFNVTVIDNNSQDGTVERLHTWQARGLHLIQNQTNNGYAMAHNQAIAVTDSDYVLTLNPDVLLTPTFLERIVDAVEASSKCGSAAGKLLRISRDQFRAGVAALSARYEDYVIDSAGLTMYKTRRQHLRGYLQNAASTCLEPADIFGPDGAAALYRREMLEDIAIEGQYFDESFRSHKEDVDLAWRAQLLGWASVYTPDAIAYHVRHFRPGERRHIRPEVRRDAVKNRWLLLVKNELPASLLPHLPYILAYDLGILAYMILFEQRSLSALGRMVRLMPAALRWRREIQQRRRQDGRSMRRWFT